MSDDVYRSKIETNLLLRAAEFHLCHTKCVYVYIYKAVAYPGILFGGGGVPTNSVQDRGQGGRESGGGSPLVRGSGGSCNFVQEISFHIVKFSQFLVL